MSSFRREDDTRRRCYNARHRPGAPMSTVRARAEVIIHSPLFSPFRQNLDGPTVSIGRASECTIPIKDRFLSRKHAELVTVGDTWVLKDLGSANGTYVNGSRVSKDVA